MEFEELPIRWQAQPAGAELPPEAVLAQVVARSRELGLRVRRRDRLETGVALAIVPFFAAATWLGTHPVSRLGAAIVTLACLFIPLRLAQARRAFDDAPIDRPLASFLREERRRVDDQKRLLETILWWYLGPLGVGVVLLFGGGSSGPSTAIYAIAVMALYGAIYLLNQRAVATDLTPRLTELDALLSRIPGEASEQR